MLPAVLGYYGMSEVGTISNTKSPDNLGILAPGCQVKIKCQETGVLLGPNQVGEIIAKTPSIMIGYLNRDSENKAFFDDTDGFVHTGDLGYYDDNGILYYSGRSKELIKYQNCHLYPGEIEEKALKHPDIVDIAVYGKPDPKVQELVSAIVVRRENSKITEEDVIRFINEKSDLAYFKHIRGGVTFVREIPRNPQGKIIRSKIHTLI